MSDMDWPDVLPEPGSMIVSAGFSALSLDGSGAVLLSGDTEAAMAQLAPGAPMLGLLDEQPEFASFALRIAPDRALLCSDLPLDIAPGTLAAGFSVRAAGDHYSVFRLEGARARLILAALVGETQASSFAVAHIGDSACLVSSTPAGFEIRVPRADAPAIWGLVSHLADAL